MNIPVLSLDVTWTNERWHLTRGADGFTFASPPLLNGTLDEVARREAATALATVLTEGAPPRFTQIEIVFHAQRFLAGTDIAASRDAQLVLALHARTLFVPPDARTLLWKMCLHHALQRIEHKEASTDELLQADTDWLRRQSDSDRHRVLAAIGELEQPTDGLRVFGTFWSLAFDDRASPLEAHRARELARGLDFRADSSDAWESQLGFGRYLAISLRGIGERFKFGDRPGAILENLLWAWPGAVVEATARLLVALVTFQRCRSRLGAGQTSVREWQKREKASPVWAGFGWLRVGITGVLLVAGIAYATRTMWLRRANDVWVADIAFPQRPAIHRPAHWLAGVSDLSTESREELSRRLGSEKVKQYFAGSSESRGARIGDPAFLRQVLTAAENSPSLERRSKAWETIAPVLDHGTAEELGILLSGLAGMPPEVWSGDLLMWVDRRAQAGKLSEHLPALVERARQAQVVPAARKFTLGLAFHVLEMDTSIEQRRWSETVLRDLIDDPALQTAAEPKLRAILGQRNAAAMRVLPIVAESDSEYLDDILFAAAQQLDGDNETWDGIMREKLLLLVSDHSANRRQVGYRRVVRFGLNLPKRYLRASATTMAEALRTDDSAICRRKAGEFLRQIGADNALPGLAPVESLAALQPFVIAALRARLEDAPTIAAKWLNRTQPAAGRTAIPAIECRQEVYWELIAQGLAGRTDSQDAVRGLSVLTSRPDLAASLGHRAAELPRADRARIFAFTLSSDTRFEIPPMITDTPARESFLRSFLEKLPDDLTDDGGERLLEEIARAANAEERVVLIKAASRLLGSSPRRPDATWAVRELGRQLAWLETAPTFGYAFDGFASNRTYGLLLHSAPQLEPRAQVELASVLLERLMVNRGLFRGYTDDPLSASNERAIVDILCTDLASESPHARQTFFTAMVRRLSMIDELRPEFFSDRQRTRTANFARLWAALLRVYAEFADQMLPVMAPDIAACGDGILALAPPALVGSVEFAQLKEEYRSGKRDELAYVFTRVFPYWLASPHPEVRGYAESLAAPLARSAGEHYLPDVVLESLAVLTTQDLRPAEETWRGRYRADTVSLAQLRTLAASNSLDAFSEALRQAGGRPERQKVRQALFAIRLLLQGNARTEALVTQWFLSLESAESEDRELAPLLAVLLRLAFSPAVHRVDPAIAEQLLTHAVRDLHLERDEVAHAWIDSCLVDYPFADKAKFTGLMKSLTDPEAPSSTSLPGGVPIHPPSRANSHVLAILARRATIDSEWLISCLNDPEGQRLLVKLTSSFQLEDCLASADLLRSALRSAMSDQARWQRAKPLLATVLQSVSGNHDYNSEPVMVDLALGFLRQEEAAPDSSDAEATLQVLNAAVLRLRNSFLLDVVLEEAAFRPAYLTMLERLPFWYNDPAPLPNTRSTLRSIIYRAPELASISAAQPVPITPEQKTSAAQILARIGPFDERDTSAQPSSFIDTNFAGYVDALLRALPGGGYRPTVERILKFAEALPPARRDVVRHAAESIHHVSPPPSGT